MKYPKLYTASFLAFFWILPGIVSAQMYEGYSPTGFSGPVGSTLAGDPYVVMTSFMGRDSMGAFVNANVPVLIAPGSLDQAINYAAFNDNLLDTPAYFRNFFSQDARQITDIDGDGVFSQLAVSGLQAAGYTASQCASISEAGTYSYLSPNNSTFWTPSNCLTKLTAVMDSIGSYTLTSGGFDLVGNTGSQKCQATVVYTRNAPSFNGSLIESAYFRGTFGPIVPSLESCGVFTVSVNVTPYAGTPLVELIPAASRPAMVGDALAVAAFVPTVWPVEWAAKADEMTASLDNFETGCAGDPECVSPGAYDVQPVYWREGYSHAPSGQFANDPSPSIGGSGAGITEFCVTNPDSLLCTQVEDGTAPLATSSQVTLTSVDVTGSASLGTCPPPPVAGFIEFNNDLLCLGLQASRPFVLLVCALIAAVIYVNGIKQS